MSFGYKAHFFPLFSIFKNAQQLFLFCIRSLLSHAPNCDQCAYKPMASKFCAPEEVSDIHESSSQKKQKQKNFLKTFWLKSCQYFPNAYEQLHNRFYHPRSFCHVTCYRRGPPPALQSVQDCVPEEEYAGVKEPLHNPVVNHLVQIWWEASAASPLGSVR